VASSSKAPGHRRRRRSVQGSSTYWRWNDTYPLVSGYVLIADGTGGMNGAHSLCTAGLTAANSADRDYLITADHCFVTGYQVWGDGGPYGDLSNFGKHFPLLQSTPFSRA
jgi:hypothetical protein